MAATNETRNTRIDVKEKKKHECVRCLICEDHAVYDESFTLISFCLLSYELSCVVCHVHAHTHIIHPHTHNITIAHAFSTDRETEKNEKSTDRESLCVCVCV